MQVTRSSSILVDVIHKAVLTKANLRALILSTIVLIFVVSDFVLAGDKFPIGPIESMTPGSLCESSPVRRYPEKIVYCERNVKSELKVQIIKLYDERFGYSIARMNREEFKIDHFIPLSIGGSNSIENLWPQHKSVYTITDDLEHLLHTKISAGKIKQAEAIRVIREAKLNLARVPELIHYVNGL